MKCKNCGKKIYYGETQKMWFHDYPEHPHFSNCRKEYSNRLSSVMAYPDITYYRKLKLKRIYEIY
jgi:hypothetical protein